MTSLRERIPSLRQLLGVYGIIAILIHGWTLIWVFWKLPNWDYFLTIGEIGANFAYSMALNLFENLALLLLPFALSLALPKPWFRDAFSSTASLVAISFWLYLLYIASVLNAQNDVYPVQLIRVAPAVCLLLVAGSMLVGRMPAVRRILGDLAERATIFSYIFLPISLISLVVVIIRNA